MARRLTETWNCVTGAIQPDVREGGQDGPPGAARWRDGQPAGDGFQHVYYVRRYYDRTLLSWYSVEIPTRKRKSTFCLASRWKEYMAFLRSSYVTDDIWRFA